MDEQTIPVPYDDCPRCGAARHLTENGDLAVLTCPCCDFGVIWLTRARPRVAAAP